MWGEHWPAASPRPVDVSRLESAQPEAQPPGSKPWDIIFDNYRAPNKPLIAKYIKTVIFHTPPEKFVFNRHQWEYKLGPF